MRAGKPEVVYALRPLLLEGCGETQLGPGSCLFMGTGGLLNLPGFGVEMAIKNMEYSALDDSKVRPPPSSDPFAFNPYVLVLIDCKWKSLSSRFAITCTRSLQFHQE